MYRFLIKPRKIKSAENCEIIKSFGVFKITFYNLAEKYIKHTLVIVCLVSIERRLCQKTDLCPLYFYLLIATLTGVLMTRPFVYCGSLPGDFELVADTKQSHTKKNTERMIPCSLIKLVSSSYFPTV